MGWTVIRLWEYDLERDYEVGIQQIVRSVKARAVG